MYLYVSYITVLNPASYHYHKTNNLIATHSIDSRLYEYSE